MSRALPCRPMIVATLLVLAVVSSGACAPDSSPAMDEPAPGAVRGELIVSILKFTDHSEKQFDLREAGTEHALKFDEAPDVAPGTLIDVWGTRMGRTILVSHWSVVAPPAGIRPWTSALVNGTKKQSRRWAFVLVDIGGGTTLSKTAAQTRVFSDKSDSVRSYYKEVSYGIQDLDGDVLGPLPYSVGGDSAGLCESFQQIGPALRPMISGQYDQYLYFIGTPIRGCLWGGVATLGTAARPTSDSYYNALADCGVLVQEPGHNLGMVHSSALRCSKGGARVSMIVPEDGSCEHDEYGNSFDPMGGGNPGSTQVLSTCFHMNGVQKAYQDWLEGCNIVKATTSGTFTIYPIEKPCDGVQVLQVPLPASRTLKFPPSQVATLTSGTISAYYLELRTPIGLDKPLKTPRVFVVAAGNLKDARLRGNPNWLIDTVPSTTSVDDAALGVGKTFTDPAVGGPKFTVVSADATKAVIKVELGGSPASDAPGMGTCSDDSPFQAPGPDVCAAAPLSSGDGGVMGGEGADAGTSAADARSGDASVPKATDARGAADSMLPVLKPDAGTTAPAMADASSGGGGTTVTGATGCHCNVAAHAGSTGPGAWPWALAAAVFALSRRRWR